MLRTITWMLVVSILLSLMVMVGQHVMVMMLLNYFQELKLSMYLVLLEKILIQLEMVVLLMIVGIMKMHGLTRLTEFGLTEKLTVLMVQKLFVNHLVFILLLYVLSQKLTVHLRYLWQHLEVGLQRLLGKSKTLTAQ